MEKQETIKNTLVNIFGFLQIEPEYEIEGSEENIYKVNISGENLSSLIGFRGQSLEALENLIELMLFRKYNEPTKIVLDINGYKNQRVEKIQDLAKKLIDKVRFFERNVEMPPMNNWERRQVHVFVTEYDDIVSESTGEGSSRRVVLKPKKSKEESE